MATAEGKITTSNTEYDDVVDSMDHYPMTMMTASSRQPQNLDIANVTG